VLILAEAALAAVMLRRARRLVHSLIETGTSEAEAIEAALSRLQLAGIERRSLLRPHSRVWRWYRHPLAQAYRQSRRRRAAR